MKRGTLVVPGILLLGLLSSSRGLAQGHEMDSEGYHFGLPFPGTLFLAPLYAGAYEPRFGVQASPGSERVELDAGASLVLAALHTVGWSPMDRWMASMIGIGIDFHTRTSFLVEPGSGIRTEMTGIYAGANLSWVPEIGWVISDIRVRFAWIANQPVTVDALQQRPARQSDAVLDLMVATNTAELGLTQRERGVEGEAYLAASRHIRLYGGALFFLRQNLDTPSDPTLYGGLDGRWQFRIGDGYGKRPLIRGITILFGYEARGTFEAASPLAHEARLGVKLARWWDRGVMIECGYHYGPSGFGLPFDTSEDYWWIGLAFDHLAKVF